MLDRYIIIDIEQMIADYDDNQTSLEAIREQYNELCEKGVGSIDYAKDRVQISPTDDGMANQIARKEDLQEKIDGYTRFFAIYDPAWERLTEQEKYILTEFCKIKYKRKQDAIDNVCEKYGIEVSRAYALRRNALVRFRRLMFG